MDLNGRGAVVTGGARGIGLAIVEDLLAQGAAVVAVDAGGSISGEPVEPKLAEEGLRNKANAAAICGDIADRAIAIEAVELAQERFGGVDLIVNNAAIVRDGFIFKSNPEAWDAVIRTNLTGAYRPLAAATAGLRDGAEAG